MPKVRVYNDNEYPYKENFREQNINIPPGGFIEMDEGDAIIFKGTYAPIALTEGMTVEQTYKRIRIAPIPDEEPAAVETTPKFGATLLTCPACKYKASGEADMSEHAKTHKEALLVDEEAEKELAAKQKKRQKTA